MKRSRDIRVPFVAAVAVAILTGCGGPTEYADEARRCLDDFGNVLPDSYCNQPYRTGYVGGYYGSRRFYGIPRYRYGGSYSGGRVSGWHATPSTVRGGFGSTGRTMGGGRSFGSFG